MTLKRLRRVYYRTLARLAWRRLRSLSGKVVAAEARRSALAAFHRAARRVPAYRKLLADRGLRPESVTDIASFERLVPLTDKQSVFVGNDLPDLCLDGDASAAACVYTSSGYSGVFSFGLETHADADRGRAALDLMLEMYLHVTSTPTLLINALPMGVRVPASLPIVLDTSVRADAVLAVVRKMRPVCRQVVIAAEHPFLKKVLEDGLDAGIHWPQYRVWLVTGAEVMPESFRTYAGAILGHDPARPETGRVLVSTGISEVGLTVGHETDDCRRIRSAALHDAEVRRALFGETPFLPTLVQYFPKNFYLETPESGDGRTRLVVTTADARRKLPLIRYATGDWARTFSHEDVCEALTACGREELRPQIQLPFLALWGRGRSLRVAGREVFPEQIKEALYAEAALAAATTANFRMAHDGDRLRVRFQLKDGVRETGELTDRFRAAIAEAADVSAEVTLVPYRRFSDALELCYQRKFRYL
jgi:phenylacetate-CoA ligase